MVDSIDIEGDTVIFSFTVDRSSSNHFQLQNENRKCIMFLKLKEELYF